MEEAFFTTTEQGTSETQLNQKHAHRFFFFFTDICLSLPRARPWADSSTEAFDAGESEKATGFVIGKNCILPDDNVYPVTETSSLASFSPKSTYHRFGALSACQI